MIDKNKVCENWELDFSLMSGYLHKIIIITLLLMVFNSII